jgi:hypothetical protein
MPVHSKPTFINILLKELLKFRPMDGCPEQERLVLLSAAPTTYNINIGFSIRSF